MGRKTKGFLLIFAGLTLHCAAAAAETPAPEYIQPAPTSDSVAEYERKYPRLYLSEYERINYLLDRIAKSSCGFMRNRQEYGGKDASRFLRMKMMTPPWRGSYRTADEFIAKVASRSSTSGEVYQMVCGENREALGKVLQKEAEFVSSQGPASGKTPPVRAAS